MTHNQAATLTAVAGFAAAAYLGTHDNLFLAFMCLLAALNINLKDK